MSESPEAEDRALAERLRALREDLPEDGFLAALHLRLVAAGPPKPATGADRLRQWFKKGAPWVWPAVGTAMGVTAFLVASALRPLPAASPLSGEPGVSQARSQAAQEGMAASPGTVVPVSKVAVIKLDFTTDVGVEEADFQVSLPEGLSFWADGQELPLRAFGWTQPLRAGSNVIPVAVRGHKPGRYLLTATAHARGQIIEHDVVLEVTQG